MTPLLLIALAAAEPPGTRLLYGFEEPRQAEALARFAEGAELTRSQDAGVTEGRTCLRWATPAGADDGVFRLPDADLAGWDRFDYLAIDVATDDSHPYALCVELWDHASKNYGSRCTYEGVTTRPGRQTLLYPIARAVRNGASGRGWGELVDADKIDCGRLKQVKFFLTPRKDRAAVLYLDNVRLLTADAAKPSLNLPLPAGALGFQFGGPGDALPGFTTVTPVGAGGRSGLAGSLRRHVPARGRGRRLLR